MLSFLVQEYYLFLAQTARLAKMRGFVFASAAFAFTAVLLSLSGCGGSGGSGSTPLPEPPAAPELGSAKFEVNVETGEVKVSELGPSRNTVFAGAAVSFTSSSLINEGSLGRRRLSVQLRNRSQEVMTGPFDIHFRNFANVTAPATDLRALHSVQSIAGNGIAGNVDGPAASAQFPTPQAFASDGAGNLYFTCNDGTVRRLNNGIVSTVVSGLSQPRGIVFAKVFQNSPSLFIAELGANRIRRFQFSAASLTTFAGSGAASVGDNSNPLAASFNAPYGLAIRNESASDLTLLTTDSGASTLRSVSSQSGVFTTATGLTNPRGIAVGNGLTVVANTGANSIRVLTTGGQATDIGSAGFLDGTGSVVQFQAPSGVALFNGTIYVADSGNHRIRQGQLRPGALATSNGNWLFATVAGNGTAGFTDGDGSSVRFNVPVGISIADNDSILVADADNNRLRRIVSTGPFPVDIPTGAASTNEKPRLANPTTYIPNGDERTPVIQVATASLAPGAQTNLGNWDFIVPTGITAFTFIVEVEAKTSLLAPPDAVTNPGPTNPGGSPNVRVRAFSGGDPGYLDGPLASASFTGIRGMARADDGTIFVAETLNRTVRRISTTGQVSTIAGRPTVSGTDDGRGDVATLASPRGIACEPDGSVIYVTQLNNTIRRIELRADFDETVNGVDVPGSPDDAASYTVTTIAGLAGGPAFADGTNGSDARLNNPTHMVRVSRGNLVFIEDIGNRIRSLVAVGANERLASSWKVITIAGDTTTVSPADFFLDGTGLAARFSRPSSICLAPDGNLYVADSNSHRIRRVTTGGRVTTAAGSVLGYGDSNTPLSALFHLPFAIGADAANTLYVGDGGNHTIRKVGNIVQTVAGNGVIGNTEGTGKTATFSTIRCLLVLPNGDILVGEENRIRLIQRIISTGP